MARDAEQLYARRFREYEPGSLPDLRFYRFRPHRAKLFDERVLGGGVFVTAAVRRGGRLGWVSTEDYGSD
ncbi:MAG: hypothetical protein ACRDGE_05785 [Candidatus Limnocylindria bacterium]